MNKKIVSIVMLFTLCVSFSIQLSKAEVNPGDIYEETIDLTYRNVTMYAPAVANTNQGQIGVISTITVTIQSPGTGRVFVDTLPLTQVDMQGSARLAVKVASALVKTDEACDVNPEDYDFFFVVRTSAPIIGGPSAGAVMTVATISLLKNLTIDNRTIMTGMINPDGSIGPIGGIDHKIDAAYSVGAKRFLIPKGQSTYVETVMSTQNIGSTTTTIYQDVEKSYYDYAWDNYNIELVEIGEINEALENFTGTRIFYNETNGEITTEQYLTSMRPLAMSLKENASISYDEAKEMFELSEIPNVGSYYDYDNYRDFAESRLELSESTLTISEDWYDQGQYYTSTSKSFQSLIYSDFVKYACEYYDSEEVNRSSYIESLIEEIQTQYDDANEQVKNQEINGFISLQSIGAAQIRASEAKNSLEILSDNYENGRVNSFWKVLYFLEDLAFIHERSSSIEWWLDIGTHFNETGNITDKDIEYLALEYINEAEQSVFYSKLLLGNKTAYTTKSFEYLDLATSIITNARNDSERGYHASAFFSALEALVKANLALELLGVNAEDRLDHASETASSNIAKKRQQGLEPIIAVSYYEYGENLRNESDFENALMYYKYSGMIAGALGYTDMSAESVASSRYVGIPESRSPDKVDSEKDVVYVSVIFILGCFAGFGIGLILLGSKIQTDNKGKKKPKKPVEKYDKNKMKRNFPNKEIPRSIKDYYNKNK